MAFTSWSKVSFVALVLLLPAFCVMPQQPSSLDELYDSLPKGPRSSTMLAMGVSAAAAYKTYGVYQDMCDAASKFEKLKTAKQEARWRRLRTSFYGHMAATVAASLTTAFLYSRPLILPTEADVVRCWNATSNDDRLTFLDSNVKVDTLVRMGVKAPEEVSNQIPGILSTQFAFLTECQVRNIVKLVDYRTLKQSLWSIFNRDIASNRLKIFVEEGVPYDDTLEANLPEVFRRHWHCLKQYDDYFPALDFLVKNGRDFSWLGSAGTPTLEQIVARYPATQREEIARLLRAKGAPTA
ncbi:MAG: hypothetical protein QG604_722 [Candidatus Dependentiae bacterium]|nr:hypothetical protein [Candidatus Dependentiae bacterium]